MFTSLILNLSDCCLVQVGTFLLQMTLMRVARMNQNSNVEQQKTKTISWKTVKY